MWIKTDRNGYIDLSKASQILVADNTSVVAYFPGGTEFDRVTIRSCRDEAEARQTLDSFFKPSNASPALGTYTMPEREEPKARRKR